MFPQLLQLPPDAGLGLSLLHASLVLVPSGLAMLAMSPVAGRVEQRFGPKPLLIAGALIIAAAYSFAVVVDLEVWHVLIINTVIGIGIGLGYAAMPTLIMAAVPTSETGAANGINTLMRSLGTTVAAAIIAAILANSSEDVSSLASPLAARAEVARAVREGNAHERRATARAGFAIAPIGLQRVRKITRLEQLLTFMSVGGEEWRLAGYRQFAHRSYRCRVESMR